MLSSIDERLTAAIDGLEDNVLPMISKRIHTRREEVRSSEDGDSLHQGCSTGL